MFQGVPLHVRARAVLHEQSSSRPHPVLEGPVPGRVQRGAHLPPHDARSLQAARKQEDSGKRS